MISWSVIYRRFLPQIERCHEYGEQYLTYEEKKTDANIACHILNDAYQDRFDCCYVVSGDSDRVPPLEMVGEYHMDKVIIVAHPPKRKSTELCQIANGRFSICRQRLKDSQLPEGIQSKVLPQIK
uniref:NYN domain-containing protein n=1 Tax=Candidatus Kentrum sp. FW TaxID=2126338 RepID=A0A450S5G7_9GAMM|nr:MAG: NYN domain-containing protein [Candidatus Kentron sp. FW]